MNLATTLHLAGMNRNTYNTLDRRIGLPFMTKRLVDDKARDKFGVWHALALASLNEFRTAGLEPLVAAKTVDGLFDFIADYEPDARTGETWITGIHYMDGTLGWVGGDRGAKGLYDKPERGMVSVCLDNVWQTVANRMDEASESKEA